MDPGLTIAGMNAPLARITSFLAAHYTYPAQWDKTKNATLIPVRDFVAGPVRPALLATLAAMAAILLMACANVAALMLGQVDGRGEEMALRTALGAGRLRLLQQLGAEALLVGLMSGVAGAGVALTAFPMLVHTLPLGALAETARAGWPVMLMAMVIALAGALLVAAVPVFALWRSDLRDAIGTARTTGLSQGGRLESGLVVLEVALAVLMASGAALLIRSVDKLGAIDPGIDAGGVGVIDMALPANLAPPDRRRLLAEVVPGLAALPGVRSAAATSKLPLRGTGDNWGIVLVAKPELPMTTTAFRVITPDYFRVLGMALKRGRLFEEADRAAPAPVVVINEALARKYFAGGDPIGQQIGGAGPRPATIVGVVADAAEARLTDAAVPARYMLYEHAPYAPAGNALVLKLQRVSDMGPALAAARALIEKTIPGAAVQTTTSLQQVLAESMGPARQTRSLLALLAGLALVLGAVGVYGVTAHAVSRRQREIGIRLALGMRRSRVVGRILVRGGMLIGAGIAAGVLASLFVTRVVASLLYGVAVNDPVALLGATATLLAAGLAATAIPAWRASRFDPAVVLHE